MMTIEEQAAFYKTLVRRGISIFPAPAVQNELTVVVNKVLTTLDSRVYIDGTNKAKGFVTEEEAIDFAKRFIDWTFESTASAETKEPEIANCYFEAHMMIDLGFGPQNVALGQLVSDCQKENWYATLKQGAEDIARKYLVKHYPGRDPDQIQKSVKVRPVN